jgi:hypothetical protein
MEIKDLDFSKLADARRVLLRYTSFDNPRLEPW